VRSDLSAIALSGVDGEPDYYVQPINSRASDRRETPSRRRPSGSGSAMGSAHKAGLSNNL